MSSIDQPVVTYPKLVKGVQERCARAILLIKKSNNCHNCENSYYRLGEGTPYHSLDKICNLHNCEIHREEWCKHHKRSNNGS